MLRKLPAVLLCLLLACAVTAAPAADTSRENCETLRLAGCNLLVLKTNQYAEGRPVIVFLPGGNECGDLTLAARWLRRYELYDRLEADLVAAAFRRQPLKPSDWKNPCNDLLAFLQEKAAGSPFPVLIDAVSLSGYGGCNLAQLLIENGFPEVELNLADACIPRYVTAEWLTRLAGQGVRINLWGCGGKANVSAETRRLIEELEGTENIRGVIVDAGHGAVLHSAIYDHGLHEAYMEKTP